MANAHPFGRADPPATAGIALVGAARGAGRIVFRGVGENFELTLQIHGDAYSSSAFVLKAQSLKNA
jgi:hypothetical protein